MEIATRIRGLRSELAHRRTQRVAYRRLSAELAAFHSPSERAELDNMLGRYSAEETDVIRAILNRQDYERQRRGSSSVGGRLV